MISGGSVPPFPWPICESYFSARREAQKKCRCNRPIPVPAVAYGRRCVFHDGGTEKEGFRPAAGRHGIYGDGKAGGRVQGRGAQLLQEERPGGAGGAGRAGGRPGAGRHLPEMREAAAADGGREAAGVLLQGVPGEVVARASGADKAEGGVFLHLRRVRGAV